MFFIYFKFCDLLVNSPFPRVPQELRIRKRDQNKNRCEGKEREQRRWIEAGRGKGHGLRKEEKRGEMGKEEPILMTSETRGYLEQSSILAGEGCFSQNWVKIMEIYEWGTREVMEAQIIKK